MFVFNSSLPSAHGSWAGEQVGVPELCFCLRTTKVSLVSRSRRGLRGPSAKPSAPEACPSGPFEDPNLSPLDILLIVLVEGKLFGPSGGTQVQVLQTE